MLPPIQQERLKPFVRVVKQVDTLVGATFKWADGGIKTLNEEGAAYFACDGTTHPQRAFLFLSSALATGPEDFAVATILHEYAHGLNYLDWDYMATEMDDTCIEAYCWFQAGAWAAQRREVFKGALNVVTICLRFAAQELTVWASRELLLGESVRSRGLPEESTEDLRD